MKKNDYENAPNQQDVDQVLKDRTFIVKIKCNQNHSMQGSVQWVEQGRIVNFRSEMELLSLLIEAVDDKEIRSWEDDNLILSIVKGDNSKSS